MICNELTEIFADAPFGIWTALMVRLNGCTRHDASLIVGFALALGMDASDATVNSSQTFTPPLGRSIETETHQQATA